MESGKEPQKVVILYFKSRHGAVKKWRGGMNHKRCSRCPGFFMVSRFHTGRANRKGSSTANKTSEYQNSVKRNTSARMTGSGNSFSGMVS